ncbi:MAG: PLDc_N domain-containing protein [Clostridiales bacterium]|nr:PLDc_N domain-containing protein [Clostridiales bacterium]
MNLLIEYLPFLIPAVVIQIGLMVAALIHIFTHPRYRAGNRIVWVLVSVCFSIIGPIIYFAVGRSDE